MFPRNQFIRPALVVAVVVVVVLVAGIVSGWIPLFDGSFDIGLGDSDPAVPAKLSEDALATKTAEEYFAAWERADYDAMFNLLTASSRAARTRDAFVGRYQAITDGALLTSVKVQSHELTWPGAPNASLGSKATLPYAATLESARFGTISETNALPLVREGEQWRVDWRADLIFAGLTDDSIVSVQAADAVRGTILDRNGRVLAGQGQVLSIGLIPGQIKDEDAALAALEDYLGLDKDFVKSRYANAQPDWWVPLRKMPKERLDEAQEKLGGASGIGLRLEPGRVYPEKELAAHILGYVSGVTAEDLTELKGKGYEDGDYVGRAGIEAWAEQTLAGRKGGELLIMDEEGEIQRTVARRESVPGGQIRLTLDLELQRAAETMLGDRAGSIVLMDVRDNSILAMASRPAYDPNGFVIGMSDEEWQRLTEDSRQPFQHRAALSSYPTGSIFKVVTMAAALEHGGFAEDSSFYCPGSWEAPGGLKMGCWVPEGHGQIDLMYGLASSCDVVFYEIGKALNEQDPMLLPQLARSFGLGQASGTPGLLEAEGIVPDRDWKQREVGQEWYVGDAVNMAIGQGFLTATPLQMANLYSALADDGMRREPVLVASSDSGEGVRTQYQARALGQLPLSPDTLDSIRRAMVMTTADPKGTAYYAFAGSPLETAGKTGSAENENPEAHAWFAGYAPANDPQVVVVAMVEGGEHGSDVAAPMGRQMLEHYFNQER